VQQARRDAGLQVSDRIRLTLGADPAVRSQIEPHQALVAGETLALQVDWDDSAPRSTELEGCSVHVSVARMAPAEPPRQ
jgi:isoleucyl-tRNA synthetase